MEIVESKSAYEVYTYKGEIYKILNEKIVFEQYKDQAIDTNKLCGIIQKRYIADKLKIENFLCFMVGEGGLLLTLRQDEIEHLLKTDIAELDRKILDKEKEINKEGKKIIFQNRVNWGQIDKIYFRRRLAIAVLPKGAKLKEEQHG